MAISTLTMRILTTLAKATIRRKHRASRKVSSGMLASSDLLDKPISPAARRRILGQYGDGYRERLASTRR
jgi:hypothetical protein